jgi:hypothetical protein
MAAMSPLSERSMSLAASASPASSKSASMRSVALLRAPRGRPRGLPEKPFRNGPPRQRFGWGTSATREFS